MRRVLSLLFATAMMLAFMVPAASAQLDSTPDAVDVASPQASPEAVEREEGETDYRRGINMITIELTGLEDDVDPQDTIDTLDPEADLENGQLTFVDELDAPGDCRMFQFEVEDAEPFSTIFIGICADDDFGLWVFGSREDAVTHTLEQFEAGEADLVPEGYNAEEED